MLPQLLLVPLLIAVNAFFVIAEYALVAVRSAQIEQLRATHPLAAAALRKLKSQMASAIGTIQICITMTNLVLGSVGEPAMTKLLLTIFSSIEDVPGVRGVSAAVSFLIVTLLTVVLSELVPKAVTLQYTLPLAQLIAGPILFIQRALMPLVWIMNTMANLTTRILGLGPVTIGDEKITADELRHITSEAADHGNLTLRERTLILNSLTLGRRTAAEVMVPRTRASYLDIQRSMKDNLAAISSYLFSRMPLCDGGMDQVLGVVYTKEFLTAQAETDDSTVLLLIARPPVFVPVTLALDRLLQRFHDEQTHLLFLVDEHGSVKGIVTLTDVVNELLGPMHEGADSRIVSKDETSIVVRAEMPIAHLADHMRKPGWGDDAQSKADNVRSVGGLLVSRLGRVPRAGESVTINGMKLTATKATSRHVDEVRAELTQTPIA